MYAVMWSEHCSYKSSKVHLAYFGETTTPAMRERMLAGIGENAGVVDIGDGWAVTFKIESHNHPSYVEPYQGAATGVGGIVRDIMAMGARPIAVADPLRFGPAEAPDTRRVLPGVVAGIGGYGNSLGLPNIGGEVVFDASYAGNPLVNALCVGALRAEDLHRAFASGTGNKIILFGARTGLDGIGGVSVLASETFDGDESAAGRKKLPSVQVGDPFMEKVLIECCLELIGARLVVGIQDLGGAGLSCATSELASAGDGGMRIELDAVPLRASGMTPAEILSQRVAGADVRGRAPGRRRRVPGDLPPVGRPRHGDRRGHRRRPARDHVAGRDRRRRAAAHGRPRRPGVPAPGRALRPPGRARRRRARQAPAPGGAVRAARRDPADGREPQPRLARVGHRPVRPLRPRQHRLRPARRRRDGPGGRAHRPGCRGRHGLQRPLRRARPLRGHPARPRRGLPERGEHRGGAARRHQLPELRLAGGPARHVAVP